MIATDLAGCLSSIDYKGGLCSILSVSHIRQVYSEVLIIVVLQVGEERMLYLLSYASIFVPLPNFCLLQVAGQPFTMAATNMKQIPQPITTTRISHSELPTVLQQEAPRIEQNTTKKVTRQTE